MFAGDWSVHGQNWIQLSNNMQLIQRKWYWKIFYLSNKYFFVDSFDPLMHHFNFKVYMSASTAPSVECESKSGFKGRSYSLGHLISKRCKCPFCANVFSRSNARQNFFPFELSKLIGYINIHLHPGFRRGQSGNTKILIKNSSLESLKKEVDVYFP